MNSFWVSFETVINGPFPPNVTFKILPSLGVDVLLKL